MKKLFTLLTVVIILLSTANSCLIAENEQDEVLRKAYGVYDLQKFDFVGAEYYTTNYGIFGLNVAQNRGGLFWPKQTENQYIFASGFWFGAQKMKPDKTGLRKYVSISYNPNNGRSWFVPGRIDDGDMIDNTKTTLYRIYDSWDFDKYDGTPHDTTEGENWPLWDKYNYPSWLMNSDSYIADPLLRNRNNENSTPLDHENTSFCTYKDTDLSRYDDGPAQRASMGYPLKLQIDQRIFTNFHVHDFAPQSDNIILQYLITNKSTDTLFDCYFSSVIDADLALASNAQNGAGNDRMNYYAGDEYHPDFAYAWTMTDQGELGKGFGYMGVTFLEVPPIGADKYLETNTDIRYHSNQNIKGIGTFSNWSIQMDVSGDEERYNMMSSGIKDGDNGPGDKRMLLSTYPFNLRPGESARIAVLIAFAKPKIRSEADGTIDDVDNLVNNIYNIALDYHDFGMSINENESNSVSVSPNPASDYIDISVSSVILNEVKDPFLRIYDVLGVMQLPRPDGHPFELEGELLRLDVSHLSPGVYFVSFGDMVRKFVKI